MCRAERFWSHVDRSAGPEGCWIWTKTKSVAGYGKFADEGRVKSYAHRVSYELAKGPIPDGLHIDHLCRVRNCVNPAHLEAVTPAENARRGEGICAKKSRQTHCAHGHPLSGANLYIEPGSGSRKCRECNRLKQARRRKRLTNQQTEEKADQ